MKGSGFNLLEIEEKAEQLLDTLELLHKEVGSYHTAGATLQESAGKLNDLIMETEEAIKESHLAIRTLREVGGEEMINRLEELQSEVKKGKLLGLVNLVLLIVLLGLIGWLLI